MLARYRIFMVIFSRTEFLLRFQYWIRCLWILLRAWQILGWEPNGSSDTYSYVIFDVTGSTSTPIDTIVGINNTFYTSALVATTGSQAFFSSKPLIVCGNPSAYVVPCRHSIYLTGALDVCSSSIQLKLEWLYQTGQTDRKYYIFVSEKTGEAFVPLDTVQTTSYSHTNFKTINTLYLLFQSGPTMRQELLRPMKFCITASRHYPAWIFLYIRSAKRLLRLTLLQ